MKILDNIKLADNERKSIVEAVRRLKTDLPISRVILFGSKARETAHSDSDIDLLVLTNCLVTSRLRADVSDRIAQINLENDADLSSIVVSEQDWDGGLLKYTLIHSEIERDGCEI